MVKKELAKKLAYRMDISLFNAELLIDRFLRNMLYGIRKDHKLVLSNFGTFEVVRRNEKAVINPLNKEKIIVPAHNKVVFKVSEKMLEKLNPEIKQEGA